MAISENAVQKFRLLSEIRFFKCLIFACDVGGAFSDTQTVCFTKTFL